MFLHKNMQCIFWVEGVLKGQVLVYIYCSYSDVCLYKFVGVAMRYMGCGGGFIVLVHLSICIMWCVFDLVM